MGRARPRATYANVVATLAPVVAVAGGTARGLQTSSPTTILDAERGLTADNMVIMDLPGIGDFRGKCDSEGAHLSWKNRTDRRQTIFWVTTEVPDLLSKGSSQAKCP